MTEKLTELFHNMWRKDAIPQEFKDSSISTNTNRKDFLKSMTITVVSHQKVDVHSGKAERPDLHSKSTSREICQEQTENLHIPIFNLTSTVKHDVFRTAHRCLSGI